MEHPEEQTEDPGYVKEDKRVGHEPEPAPEPTAEPEAAAEGAPEPESPAPQSLAEIGVFGILRFTTSLLMQQAWIELGIQALPGMEAQQNLPAARVAIDTLAFLVDKLQPDLDEAEKHELAAVVANLRVNYIQRAG
jgi:hypothetical protein